MGGAGLSSFGGADSRSSSQYSARRRGGAGRRFNEDDLDFLEHDQTPKKRTWPVALLVTLVFLMFGPFRRLVNELWRAAYPDQEAAGLTAGPTPPPLPRADDTIGHDV
jgi:hypothetical protein